MKRLFSILISVSSLVAMQAQSYSFKEFVSTLPVNNNDVYNYTVNIFDGSIFELAVTNNSSDTRRFRLKKTEISVPAGAQYSQTVCTQSTCYSGGNFFPPIDNSTSFGQSLSPGATSVNATNKPGFTFEIKLIPQSVGLFQFRFTFQDSANAADTLSFRINYTAIDPSVGLNTVAAGTLFPSISKKADVLSINNPYNESFILNVFQLDGKKIREERIAPRSKFETAFKNQQLLLFKLENPLNGQYADVKYSFAN